MSDQDPWLMLIHAHDHLCRHRGWPIKARDLAIVTLWRCSIQVAMEQSERAKGNRNGA